MNPSASNDTRKVLVIEDTPGDSYWVHEILRAAPLESFDLIGAKSLPEAVTRLAEDTIDIILLALSLPDAKGLDILARMRAAVPHLPIVVVTEDNDETRGLQAVQAGAQDYLIKDQLDSRLLKRVLRNAIERKRVEQAQHESEERFRALVQNSTDIITILAADGTVLYESPSLEKVMGYKSEAVQGLNIMDVIHPDDLPAIFEGMRTILDQPEASFSGEFRLRHADGSWRIQETTMTNLLNHPAIYGIVVNSRDVTERKRSEEAIRFQALLLNAVGQAVIATNLEDKIIYWNHSAETLYGWSAKEALGRSIVDLTLADTSREQAATIITRLRAGESWQGEFGVQRKDGTTFPALVTDTPIIDEKGTLIGIIGVSLNISERKRAEEVLRESEARFKLIAEMLPVGIAIMRLSDGIVLHANAAYCDMIGLPSDTVVGQRTSFFLSEPDEQQKLIQELKQNGLAPGRELQIQLPDGALRWVLVAMTMISLNGETVLLSGFHDITSIKALEGEQSFLAAIVESSEDAIIGTTLEGVILSWNQGAERLYGYQPNEAIGHSIQMLVPPELPDEIPALLKHLNQGDAIPQLETISMTQSGQRIDVSLAISPIKTLDGTIIGVAAIARDITERKQAEEMLRQYNRRLEILREIDRSILTAQPPQTIAEMVAQNLIELTHCDAIRIIALDSHDNLLAYLVEYPPASQTSHDLLWQAIEDHGLPESFHRGEALLIDDTTIPDSLWIGFEEVLTDKGARAWIIVPLIARGQLVGILAAGSLQPLAFTSRHITIAREVADQLAIALYKNRLDKQIQENAHELEARVSQRTNQLHSAKERIEAILMSASDAMIVANLDGSIEQVNTAFTVLFGYTLEQGRAMSLFSLLDSVSTATVRRINAEFAEGGQTKYVELVGLRQDGTTFAADTALAPIVDGQPTIVICSIRDITERKRAELELRQAWAKEKELNDLKTRFVSMVSHDFRVPLASIQSSGDLLRSYSDRMTDEKKQHHFTTINVQIKHLTGLLDDMLTITKAESVGLPFHPKLTDLGLFCQTIADEMQMLAGNHQIRFMINRPGEQVAIDPELLRRALVNLLSNAVKYSPEGDVTEFSVSIGDESIEICVKDQGIGISEEDQVHLFELFHRGKNVGQISGTGLGLAIVKRIVEAHGGTITVNSGVDVGSTFTISLPLSQVEVEAK